VISRTVRELGIDGCAGRMAQEFGDHPEAARDRMQWVRAVVGEMVACSTPLAARPAARAARRAP
jgi:hypothetical protein